MSFSLSLDEWSLILKKVDLFDRMKFASTCNSVRMMLSPLFKAWDVELAMFCGRLIEDTNARFKMHPFTDSPECHVSVFLSKRTSTPTLYFKRNDEGPSHFEILRITDLEIDSTFSTKRNRDGEEVQIYKPFINFCKFGDPKTLSSLPVEAVLWENAGSAILPNQIFFARKEKIEGRDVIMHNFNMMSASVVLVNPRIHIELTGEVVLPILRQNRYEQLNMFLEELNIRRPDVGSSSIDLPNEFHFIVGQ